MMCKKCFNDYDPNAFKVSKPLFIVAIILFVIDMIGFIICFAFLHPAPVWLVSACLITFAVFTFVMLIACCIWWKERICSRKKKKE